MLIWFAVLAPVLVAEIFRSPMVDYRLVALGALLPLIEVAVGRPWALHSLLGSVLVLTVVMVATPGRRLARRRLLGIPIGMFLHLVLDGAFMYAAVFWWPFLGLSQTGEPLPESHGIALRLLLELVALVVAAWAYRRYGLESPAARDRLVRRGHLTRSAVG